VIEALARGLPALCLKDGWHLELADCRGLGFDSFDDILASPDVLVEDYEPFQSPIQTPSMDAIAARYLELLQKAKDVADAELTWPG
jgi:hypothetical protein